MAEITGIKVDRDFAPVLQRAAEVDAILMTSPTREPALIARGATVMRRAARTDKNQTEIVRALRQMGVAVEVIGKPVDLLVCFRGETSLMELKCPKPTDEGGSHGLTKDQVEFIARWPGKVHIVKSVGEAVEALMPGVTR